MATYPKIRVLGTVLLGLLALEGSAQAAVSEDTGASVHGDFDGDGLLDAAVSSPQSDCEKGVVYIVPAVGATAIFSRETVGIQGTAACDDRFGASLAAGDIDGDGYDDLIVGAPGATVSGKAAAGAIHVIYGSPSGLTTTGDQLFDQDSTGIQGVAEAGDEFGTSLNTGDFDCNGYLDVVIGVPLEAIGSKSEAGAVNVLYGTSTGLSSVDDIWYQGKSGVNGAAEAGDHFGASVVAGNFNGDTSGSHDCDDLAIGVPDENLSVADAGAVYVIDGAAGTGLSTQGDQLLYQNLSGVVDQEEPQDRFGARLEVADLDSDGFADLVVSVPGDACGPDAGEGRHRFFGSSGGLATAGNALLCGTYGCAIDGADLACLTVARSVRGSTASENISLSQNDDVAWGLAGNDTLLASIGNDAVFGGDGDDTLVGGPGRDVMIGGYGDDTFIIDMDCAIGFGEFVDGGPGTDSVHSHFSQAKLVSAGVVFSSIENFVLIPEGDSPCETFPFAGPALRTPRMVLSWPLVPNPAVTATSSSGLIPLDLENNSDSTLVVTIVARLSVGGGAAEQELGAVTLSPQGSTSVNIDLNDFIPTGYDTSQIPPSALVIPVSAAMTVRAEVRLTSGTLVETPRAPRIFGHLNGPTQAVFYGIQAYRDTYYSGDLRRYRVLGPGSAPNTRGTTEAHG